MEEIKKTPEAAAPQPTGAPDPSAAGIRPGTKRVMTRGTSLGSFGVSNPTGNQSSRTRSQSTDAKPLHNSTGVILEFRTTGGSIEKTEEFVSGPTLPTDAQLVATDGQVGQEVFTNDDSAETYSDYAKETIKSKKTLGVPAA